MAISMRAQDVEFVVGRLPADVVKMLKANGSRICVAGGFIRSVIAGEAPKDLDLFANYQANERELAKALAAERKVEVFVSENALTVPDHGLSVQFVTRWHYMDANVEHVLEHFDFTICRGLVYFDGEVWRGLIGDDFYADLAARRLVYTRPSDAEPGGTLLRLVKFLQRGYNVQAPTIAEIVAKLAGDIANTRPNAEPDYDYVPADVVLSKLREVDPSTIVGQVR